MADVFNYLPMLEGEEMVYVQNMIKDLSDEKAKQFASVYSSRRKDPQIILITTIIGFVGIAGIQRFLLEQIGMGILYLLTGGLCWIGTIVDLVNYKKLTYEYNFKIANEVSMIIRSRAS
jgi:TM2 domain-containing membrane protein YozV